MGPAIIKGQPLGGTDDEWIVIEPAYHAIELAEQLHDDRREGAPLFGRFAFYFRYIWFRNWVNSPAGARLGLTPIPEEPITLRMLCLKLAGTPAATRPMIGMCDSARCLQATHHQVHRAVWAEHAERTKTFLGQLGRTRTAECERLTADHTRALRVIADIDTATNKDRSS